MVQLEQPVEDLDPRGRRHRPALHLAVGVEAVVERHVIPAVSRHRRLVDLDVNLAHPIDIWVTLDLRVVDEVVEGCQAQVPTSA